MKKIAPYAGFTTCLILYAVIFIAAIPYVGQQGESYSIFNHFISELGSTRFSVNHAIYNQGLIVAAFGFGIFTIGLGVYAKTRLARISVVVGVLSSILCIGVGLVPEDHRIPHLILALCFFTLMALAATLYSWSIWKEEDNPFPKYTAWHGFAIPLSFAVFMMMPKGLMAVKRAEGALFERPEIWWLPFFEWIIFISLTSWIMMISLKMLHIHKAELQSEVDIWSA